jgi:hypothetical protein
MTGEFRKALEVLAKEFEDSMHDAWRPQEIADTIREFALSHPPEPAAEEPGLREAIIEGYGVWCRFDQMKTDSVPLLADRIMKRLRENAALTAPAWTAGLRESAERLVDALTNEFGGAEPHSINVMMARRNLIQILASHPPQQKDAQ